MKEEVCVVLQAQLVGVEQQVEKKMRVASTMLDFHRNMENVSAHEHEHVSACGQIT